jgi:hypothetical protein
LSDWPLVALGDVFEIARGGSPRPIDSYITDDPAGINWIMISDAPEGSKYISRTEKRIRPEGAQRSRRVQSGDFLTTSGLNTISVSDVRTTPLTLPPMSLQRDFACRVAAVEKFKGTHRTSQTELDTLFASLQHRAFRGEL